MRMNFESDGEKDFHAQTYCEGNYQMCWLYRMAMGIMWDDD